MKISVEVRKRSWRERAKKGRVYIFVEGESIMENMVNRTSRPQLAYRRQIMPTVLEELGLEPDTRFRWSQYCGCSCPCSPGFIFEGRAMYEKDVFVTVTDDGSMKTTGGPRVERRKKQLGVE